MKLFDRFRCSFCAEGCGTCVQKMCVHTIGLRDVCLQARALRPVPMAVDQDAAIPGNVAVTTYVIHCALNRALAKLGGMRGAARRVERRRCVCYLLVLKVLRGLDDGELGGGGRRRCDRLYGLHAMARGARLRHTTCAPHCHSTHSRAARRSHTHREPRYLPAHQIRLGDPLPRPVPSLPAH